MTTPHDLTPSNERPLLEMRSLTRRFPDVLALSAIATIYQDLNQAPQLSVTENIFLVCELTRGLRLD